MEMGSGGGQWILRKGQEKSIPKLKLENAVVLSKIE